jgi:hypothetical protein
MLNYRKLSIAIIFVILCGCKSQKYIKDDDLIAIIEKKIILPEGSDNIEKYSRYYKSTSEDFMDAVYVKHDIQSREAVKEECKRINYTEKQCKKNNYGIADPGEFVLLAKDEHFPLVLDAGCAYIEIRYNKNKDIFNYVKCENSY